MYYMWHYEKKKYFKFDKEAVAVDLGEDWDWTVPYVRYGRYMQKNGEKSEENFYVVAISCCGRIISVATKKEHAIRKAKRRLEKETRKCLKYIKYFAKRQGVPETFDKQEIIEYCDYLQNEVYND